jgi:hypothetical protein
MTNPLSFFTKLLKGAAIGFVGFNVVRGIVDQWTDGAFTKFVADIDYAAIGEGIKTFTGFLADSPWLAFSTALIAWTAIDFGVPFALNVTGEVIRTSMLAKMLNKGVMGGVEKSPGFLKTVLSLRGLALATAGVAFMVAGEAVANYVRSSVSGMTPDQVANEKLTVDAGDVVSTLGYAAGGASIGLMFGPGGALIGGILGFAYGIGSKVLEYMAASSMEKINFDELGEQQDRDKAIIAQQMLDEHAAGTRELSKAQLDAFKIQAQGPSQDRLDAVNNEIGDQRNVLGRQLSALEKKDAGKQYIPGQGPGSMGQYVDILDGSVIKANEAAKAADIAAKTAELKLIEDKAQERIDAGLATKEQLEYVAPVGFMEGVGSFFGQDSSDRVRNRAEKEAETLATNKRIADKLSKFFDEKTFDDYLSKEQRAAIIAKVESEGGNQHTIVNVIKNEGARINNVDNSDKSSSSVSFQNLVGGGSGKPAMPTG